MSTFDKATVARMATLARLKLDDDELDHFAGELSHILTWVEQLGELDTDQVEPMTSGVAGEGLRWRADHVDDGNCQDKVLGNAPEAAQGFYCVPKVVE